MPARSHKTPPRKALIRLKRDTKALRGLDELQAIDMHFLFLEVRLKLHFGASVFKRLGSNDEVDMRFVHAV